MDTQDQKIQVAPQESPQEIPQGTPEETVTETVDNQEIDYKAELEKTKERLRKAEYKLTKQNMESKDMLPEEEIARIVDEQLSERLSQVRERDTAEDVDDELGAVTTNPEERELIRFLYQNRIVKTGFSRTAIREDIQTCKLLANAKKYQHENQELALALKTKSSLGNTSVGSNLDKPSPSEDYNKYFAPQDLTFMKLRGWDEGRIKKAALEIKDNLLRKD